MMRVQVVADDPASLDLAGISGAAGNPTPHPTPIAGSQIDISVHPLADGDLHISILAQSASRDAITPDSILQ